MTYQVILQRSAEKELDALPTNLRERITTRLLTLEEIRARWEARNCKDRKVIVYAWGTIEFSTPLTTKQNGL